MRASTSSTPFLKPSDTNDKHNYITKVYFILFVHNLQFNDLIHWKDKPLKRWQLFSLTVVTVCCMALFSHNDCYKSINVHLNIISLHHIHLSFFLTHIKTSNQTIYILESKNSTYKQYFVTNVSLNKER